MCLKVLHEAIGIQDEQNVLTQNSGVARVQKVREI